MNQGERGNASPFQIILETGARGNRFGATSSPFFLQRPESPNGAEDLHYSLERGIDEGLPPRLVDELYNKIPDAEELYVGPSTILSLDEVKKRRKEAKDAGTMNPFLDFAIEYVGMGRVLVASVNSEGGAHVRIDGGANGYEREDNFRSSLQARVQNTDLESTLDAISSQCGLQSLLPQR